jgi:hypothetical protein
MSGNAWEWVDTCEAEVGQSDACYTRGGAYYTTSEEALSCMDYGYYWMRKHVADSIGFRCCADLD